jgi:hypothetical protein
MNNNVCRLLQTITHTREHFISLTWQPILSNWCEQKKKNPAAETTKINKDVIPICAARDYCLFLQCPRNGLSCKFITCKLQGCTKWGCGPQVVTHYWGRKRSFPLCQYFIRTHAHTHTLTRFTHTNTRPIKHTPTPTHTHTHTYIHTC